MLFNILWIEESYFFDINNPFLKISRKVIGLRLNG